MFKVSFVTFLLIAGMADFSHGQSGPTTEPPPANESDGDKEGSPRFWQAKLPGGSYMVALDRITSVSRHKYLLDGTLIVDEVTIDTTGQALVRFYYISPVTSGVSGTAASKLVERAAALADRTAQTMGSELQNMVVKQYPLTTHAKTIEYRLLSEKQLDVLFTSAKTAWETGKGRIFTGL